MGYLLPSPSRIASNSFAVVTAWPMWRWVWSAQWTSRPPTVVGSAARPTPRAVLYCSGEKARMRAAAVRSPFLNSVRTPSRVASGVEFGLQRCLLRGVQLRAFGVAQQTVEAARDVPQMEGQRRETEGASVDLGVGEAAAPFGDIFVRKLRMREGRRACYGIEIGVGSA